MTSITITHKTTIAELMTIFCIIPVLTLAKIAKAILTAIRTVRTWLNTRHEFGFPEDPTDESESVKLTGLQYIGFAFATCAFALLLSIDWESLI